MPSSRLLVMNRIKHLSNGRLMKDDYKQLVDGRIKLFSAMQVNFCKFFKRKFEIGQTAKLDCKLNTFRICNLLLYHSLICSLVIKNLIRYRIAKQTFWQPSIINLPTAEVKRRPQIWIWIDHIWNLNELMDQKLSNFNVRNPGSSKVLPILFDPTIYVS